MNTFNIDPQLLTATNTNTTAPRPAHSACISSSVFRRHRCDCETSSECKYFSASFVLRLILLRYLEPRDLCTTTTCTTNMHSLHACFPHRQTLLVLGGISVALQYEPQPGTAERCWRHPTIFFFPHPSCSPLLSSLPVLHALFISTEG